MKEIFFFCAIFFVSFLNCLSQPFTPDPSFGIGGKTYTNLVDINKSDEYSNDVAIQPDGSLDNSFDHDGMVFYFGFTFNATAIQSDGKILLAGVSNNDFAVVRLNPDGSPHE